MTMGPSSSGESEDSSGGGSDEASSSGGDGPLLDIDPGSSSGGSSGEEGGDGDCEVPEHVPCDDDPNNVANALGLDCGNREPVLNAAVNGNPLAAGTLTAFGNTYAFDPTEGERFAVLGSGFVADLPMPDDGIVCSQDIGDYDPGPNLDAPIVLNDVGGTGCADDPGLVGTGDCSNTLQQQFAATGDGSFDYTELRFTTQVPGGVTSFSYDLAFLTYEYPDFYDSEFNDIYIGWLESEQWTGNISFDEQGNPISLNAGFMDYLDADVDFPNGAPHPDCPEGAGCTAPELSGTCMQGHGATRWLTTNASVTEGETITVVFAIMDLGDSILDSYVFLDNFMWGCEGGQPPSTVPID